ncbi:hypothetical protein KOR42_14620 [Thalassoglobus neptunius]|uniref:Rod shape-determining protein MreD n=1 Tax=Thalassoglobus neptunius TaxID=1938619 RepID=A0A5C5X6X0_9PLAN|nr:hypothetical protein [Thalassoglobus neptunius]TWT58091.1 hypothetical protein KOR42_14620 [Thalassoglobus neptunius]
MIRNFFIAFLVWSACLTELSWSSWSDAPFRPACFPIVVLLSTYLCAPGWMVFWSGICGLMVSTLAERSVVECVGIYATVGLLAALTSPDADKHVLLTNRLIRSLWILGGLVFVELHQPLGMMRRLISGTEPVLLGKLGVTVLCAVALSLLATSLDRRSEA